MFKLTVFFDSICIKGTVVFCERGLEIHIPLTYYKKKLVKMFILNNFHPEKEYQFGALNGHDIYLEQI